MYSFNCFERTTSEHPIKPLFMSQDQQQVIVSTSDMEAK